MSSFGVVSSCDIEILSVRVNGGLLDLDLEARELLDDHRPTLDAKREGDDESRPNRRLAIDFNLTTMSLNNIMGNM